MPPPSPRSPAPTRISTDPATGKKIIEKVYTKAQLADVQGSDSLNPQRSGDVVAVAKVPYEFDGNTVGTIVAPSLFFGQHGYLPEDVDLAHNINMHATFVAGGPDIAHVRSVKGVRAVDLAPTLAVLGHFPPPLQAQGSVLTSILRDGSKYSTGQILGDQRRARQHHRDRLELHRSLHRHEGRRGRDRPAGRVSQARADTANTVTVEAGDMVGASPPESALLRDKPTLDALNKMGIDVGTLGNHEFDRGVTEMLRQVKGGQSTVDPSITFSGLNFPVVDANVISDATGKPLLQPYTIKSVGGVKVAFIGATTITTPTIVTTGGTTGVHFVDEADAINAQVSTLQHQGIHAFVVVIHEGGAPDHLPGRDGERPDQRHRHPPRPGGVRGDQRAQPHHRRHPGGRAPGDPGVVVHPGLRRCPPAARPAGGDHRRVLGFRAAHLEDGAADQHRSERRHAGAGSDRAGDRRRRGDRDQPDHPAGDQHGRLGHPVAA